MTTSLRLRVAVLLARAVVRPSLARTRTPARAAADFERGSRWFRHPPRVLHLESPLGGIPCHWISVGTPASRRAILWLHGGAFLSGSGRTHAGFLARIAQLSGIEVAAPDYRLLQEAPFPAAVEDALAAWDGLMERGYRPGEVGIGGDSAGGGLALGLLAALLARGERPAAMALLCPWADLTLSGESLRTLGPRDPLLPVARFAEVAGLYLAGADPSDPRASPLLAEFPSPPPTLVQASDCEALRSDAERVADRLRAAGGRVKLELWPGAPHVWHALDGIVPEARDALGHVADFLKAALAP